MLRPSEFLMRSGRHACPDPQAATAVIVITGASSGIGRSTANLFAQHGWRVGLIARGRAGLQATFDDVSRHGAMAAMEQADVADLGALEAAAARIERTLGPIDAWINCAGNGTYGRFLDTPAEEFQRVTEVTYMGTVHGTRVALRRFLPRDRGSIVNVCSAVAFHGMPLLSAYSGAKHAVRGFGQSVRAELAQDGSHVRLTSVFPPAVNTPFFDHAISHMGQLGRPMPPVYQPEVVAEAIRLALISGRAEMPVTSTAILFSISARFMPGLVARAIRKLGYGGQLTDQATLQERHAPTLFAASETASPARGGFDALARTGSMHIRILGVLARWRAPGRLTPQPGRQPPPGLPTDETPVQEHALD
ncbi:SDR family oxidoreductase [Paraburkholderia sediminicola]|uniref:SDR family oxidoreductase n=1 Tax=Paraburkholderia rhynchosiae TaxID=487049 RepID=A0ACC7NKI2_9BURK